MEISLNQKTGRIDRDSDKSSYILLLEENAELKAKLAQKNEEDVLNEMIVGYVGHDLVIKYKNWIREEISIQYSINKSIENKDWISVGKLCQQMELCQKMINTYKNLMWKSLKKENGIED